MSRRPRIDLDIPLGDSGTDGGDSERARDSGGSDGGGSGDSGGGSGGGSDPASILGTVGGAGDGNNDDYIRDDSGAVLYDVRGRPRKRRRSRGKARGKAAGKKVPVDALAQLLVLAHGTLAALSRTPELEINENEAKMLANPLSEVLVLYDIVPPPELLVAMQIIHASSYVYGPRIVMIRARLKEEAEARRAAAAKNITPTARDEQPFEQAMAGMGVVDTTGFDIQTNYDGLKN